MFVNQSPASRQQLADLVLTMHMSEPDVVAFAIQQLFDERVRRPSARTGEPAAQPKKDKQVTRSASFDKAGSAAP
jgi:hypothetical protein